jgi:putative phosphonate metabolism protein
VARYALYFTPAPGSPLERFGASVLGYDAYTGATLDAPPLAGIDIEAWRRGTEEPRRYGFHATLKAPFRLRDGATPDQLRDEARRFGRGREPLAVGRLALTKLGSFLALVPEAAPESLGLLAAETVAAFEPYRADLTPSERARRLAKPLPPRQTALLDRWGYPHVFEAFRFHMTLTGPLAPDEQARWADALRALAPLDEPLVIDALTLLVQDAPERSFRVLDRFPFEVAL